MRMADGDDKFYKYLNLFHQDVMELVEGGHDEKQKHLEKIFTNTDKEIIKYQNEEGQYANLSEVEKDDYVLLIGLVASVFHSVDLNTKRLREKDKYWLINRLIYAANSACENIQMGLPYFNLKSVACNTAKRMMFYFGARTFRVKSDLREKMSDFLRGGGVSMEVMEEQVEA